MGLPATRRLVVALALANGQEEPAPLERAFFTLEKGAIVTSIHGTSGTSGVSVAPGATLEVDTVFRWRAR